MIETTHNKPHSQKHDVLCAFFAPILCQKNAIRFCDTEKRQYRKQGFFIVDYAVDPDMLNSLLGTAMRAKKCVQIIRTHVKPIFLTFVLRRRNVVRTYFLGESHDQINHPIHTDDSYCSFCQ